MGKKLCLNVDCEFYKELERLCDQKGISVGDYVFEAIEGRVKEEEAGYTSKDDDGILQEIIESWMTGCGMTPVEMSDCLKDLFKEIMSIKMSVAKLKEELENGYKTDAHKLTRDFSRC